MDKNKGVYSDQNGCKVDLNFSGGKLIAKDNNSCGGLNVSFSGEYIKGAILENTQPIDQTAGSVSNDETKAVSAVVDDTIRLKITELSRGCISENVKSQGVGEIIYDLREVHNQTCGGDPNTAPLIVTARIELPSGQISFLNLTPSQIFQEASLQLGFTRSQLVYFRIFGQDKIQYSLGSGTNFAYSGGQQQWYLVGKGNYIEGYS